VILTDILGLEDALGTMDFKGKAERERKGGTEREREREREGDRLYPTSNSLLITPPNHSSLTT
jgi:hypothetical protein